MAPSNLLMIALAVILGISVYVHVALGMHLDLSHQKEAFVLRSMDGLIYVAQDLLHSLAAREADAIWGVGESCLRLPFVAIMLCLDWLVAVLVDGPLQGPGLRSWLLCAGQLPSCEQPSLLESRRVLLPIDALVREGCGPPGCDSGVLG